MSQNVVLDSRGDVPLGSTSCITSDFAPAAHRQQVDPVVTVTSALHHSAARTRTDVERRPFDAQYWACWVVAVLWPLVVACLLLAY